MWTELEESGLFIPVRAVPKERPKVHRGGAHYSKRYTNFRNDVMLSLREQGVELSGIDYPVSMEVSFKTSGFHLQLRPVSTIYGGIARPTHVRGDADNMAGGVMDALQDGRILSDDKHVLELHTKLWEVEDDDE